MKAVRFRGFLFALAPLAIAVMTSTAPASTTDEEEVNPNAMNVFWKDSLRFESNSKKFKVKVGGRMHLDVTLTDEDSNDVPKIEDAVEFRRARLYFSGEFYENLEFKFQYDFAGFSTSDLSISTTDANGDGNADDGGTSGTVKDNSPKFKDVYIGAKDFYGLGSLRLGQFKEPLGLEQLTSSNHITFVERSLADTFYAGRSTGIMYRKVCGESKAERATFAVGMFRATDDRGNEQEDGSWVYTARATGLVYQGSGDNSGDLIHVGASATIRQGDSFRFRARPEVHVGSRFVDTNSISAEDASIFNVELASIFGPFSLQGEYVTAMVDGRGATSNFDGQAWYAQASYMLTGESRRYDNATAAFKGPKVADAWNGQTGCGHGAWELAARVSSIDLDDIDTTTVTQNGGDLLNFTAGLNWYMTNNHRVMLNYIHSELDNEPSNMDGSLDALLIRFQMAF